MAEIREILVLHHSHTDIGYTHTQPVLWELERRFIDQAIELCEQTADYPEESQPIWTCETTGPVLHWLEHASDNQIDRFKKLVEAGRISIGGMLCNITPLYSAEQLYRSLYPIRELRERFGAPIRGAINHDVNGLPWPITELLLDAGIEILLMGINIHFGGFPLHRPLGFRWQSPDGREILAFNGEHYSGFERELRLTQNSTAAMAEGLAAYTERLHSQDYPYDFIYLTSTHPYFADNNPPNPDLVRMVRQWNDEGRTPVIRFANAEMVADRLRRQPEGSVPLYAGDWTDYWNFGAGSSALETRINRRSRARLMAAEALEVARPDGGSVKSIESVHNLTRQAYWNLNFYDEHSWGAAASVTAPDRDGVVAQWYHKANYAYQARDLTSLLMRDRLEETAANPATGQGTTGVLAYNGAPAARSVYLRIPQNWLDGTWQHFLSKIHAIEMEQEGWSARNSRLAGPIELPAYGYKLLPIDNLTEASEAPGLEVAEGRIESPYHRLRFDPQTGRILSLFDKKLAHEFVDAESEWSFFGFVQETDDPAQHQCQPPNWGRDAFFDFTWQGIHKSNSGWKADWSALRQPPTRLEACEVEKTPDGVSLILRWTAPGVERLEQRIKLCANRPAIELYAGFYKRDIRTPDGIYFTFPCDLPSWRAHFDTADLPVEFDAEQLPGSCRDWVTVGNWVAVHNETHGLTVASPDAPLFQIGDFNFGKRQEQVSRERKPLLLAWSLNNYWNTNFRASQPGYLRFRYELITHGPYDPVVSTMAGLTAITPIELHPVVSMQQAQEEQLLQVDGPGIIPLHIKRAEPHPSTQSGDTFIVRLMNVGDTASAASVALSGKTIRQAYLANTLEEAVSPLVVAGGGVSVDVPARGLVTVGLVC